MLVKSGSTLFYSDGYLDGCAHRGLVVNWHAHGVAIDWFKRHHVTRMSRGTTLTKRKTEVGEAIWLTTDYAARV